MSFTQLLFKPSFFYFQDAGINAELGITASEDAVLDILAEAAEKEIVSGGSNTKHLIGSCAHFLTKLCRNFGLMQKVRFDITIYTIISVPHLLKIMFPLD